MIKSNEASAPFEADDGSGNFPSDFKTDFQSTKINTALTGRMRRMWVYCSSLDARENEDVRGVHQIASERAVRAINTGPDDDLKLLLPGKISLSV
jgi:hypothetical protein